MGWEITKPEWFFLCSSYPSLKISSPFFFSLFSLLASPPIPLFLVLCLQKKSLLYRSPSFSLPFLFFSSLCLPHQAMSVPSHLDEHPVSDDRASPWGSMNLQMKWDMPQCGTRGMIGQKIRWYIIKLTILIIRTQLNQTYTSKRRLPEEEAWRYLNINQISITCPSRGCRRRHLISWPQGGLKTRDVT